MLRGNFFLGRCIFLAKLKTIKYLHTNIGRINVESQSKTRVFRLYDFRYCRKILIRLSRSALARSKQSCFPGPDGAFHASSALKSVDRSIFVVQKNPSTYFDAPKLQKARSGCWIIRIMKEAVIMQRIQAEVTRPNLSNFWSFNVRFRTTGDIKLVDLKLSKIAKCLVGY